MKNFLIVLLSLGIQVTNLFAAEAGMPQLNPEFWASQAFWLIIIFISIYILISKINSKFKLIYLTKKFQKKLKKVTTFAQ